MPLAATPVIPVLAKKKPKPVHCRKGRRKVRKKGKVRCVKIHRRRGRR
jgi:hypothetical protein